MKILIIQILRLGDALQIIPVIKGIRHYFPDATISVLTTRFGADILNLYEDVDEIYQLDKEYIVEQLTAENTKALLSGFEQLKADLGPLLTNQWDWVINFSYTFPSALITYLMRARHVSGFTVNRHRQYISKDKWFSFSLASFMNRRYSNFNWIDINRNILGLDPLPKPPYLSIKDPYLEKVKSVLSENGYQGEQLIGMCPGASGEHKRWPAEKFAILGKQLALDHGYRILIFGNQAERSLGRQIQEIIGDGALNLAGVTDIESLKAFLSLCDLLVTNDTGPMHLANAVATPVVGLFFCTHFVETGPYGCDHIALHPDIDCFPCQGTAACTHKMCLDRIQPETVLAAVLNRLNGGREEIHLPPEDRENVKAYVSFFDAWGNLDWRPITQSEVHFRDIEKIMLKDTWLDHCGIIEAGEPVEDRYVPEALKNYRKPTNPKILQENLLKYHEKQTTFRNLLLNAQQTTLKLQSTLLSNPSDRSTIQSYGMELQEIENRISSNNGTTSISFLSELLTQLQEDIELSDPLKLSMKTAEVYRLLIQIVDGMIKRTGKFETHLGKGF